MCTCAGVQNEYNEGSECRVYSDYTDEWYNGEWCFANTSKCSDASEYPHNSIPGLGASRHACQSGKLCIMPVDILI